MATYEMQARELRLAIDALEPDRSPTDRSVERLIISALYAAGRVGEKRGRVVERVQRELGEGS